MYIIRQPKNSAKFPFTVPGVPFVPAIAIFFNVLLIVNLNPWTYIRFSVWTALGELLPTEEVGGGGRGRVTSAWLTAAMLKGRLKFKTRKVH